MSIDPSDLLIPGLLIIIAVFQFKEDKDDKRRFAFAKIIITVAAIIAAYIFGIEEGGKKQKILDNTNSTLSLSKDIKILQGLNNQIVSRVEEITSESKIISESSKKLITNIDNRAKHQYAESAISGTLVLKLKRKLKNTDMVKGRFGGVMGGNTVKQLKTWKPPPTFIGFGGEPIVMLSIIKNKLAVTLTVYDMFGNWIVDIINNDWRRNPNYTGKFNYDNTGFEIIDNQNNVALSLDLLDNYNIVMQGYLVNKERTGMMVAGKTFKTIPIKDEVEINRALKEVGIIKIFDYTGSHWLHRRSKKPLMNKNK